MAWGVWRPLPRFPCHPAGAARPFNCTRPRPPLAYAYAHTCAHACNPPSPPPPSDLPIQELVAQHAQRPHVHGGVVGRPLHHLRWEVVQGAAERLAPAVGRVHRPGVRRAGVRGVGVCVPRQTVSARQTDSQRTTRAWAILRSPFTPITCTHTQTHTHTPPLRCAHSPPKICDLEVALQPQQQVLRLDVAVDDMLGVAVRQRLCVCVCGVGGQPGVEGERAVAAAGGRAVGWQAGQSSDG